MAVHDRGLLQAADDDSLPGLYTISPLTLGFRGPTEDQYRAELARRTLPNVRAGLVLGLLLYALFGLLDLAVAPGQIAGLWLIRFAIVCPILLACLAATWSPRFPPHREPLVAGTMAVAVAGIIAMTAIIPPPGSYLYYAGLLLAIMAYTTLVRLRFVTAAILAAAELAAYLAVDSLLVQTSSSVMLNNVFFLVSASTLGLSACYALELGARRAFVQRRLIAARRAELERANELLRRSNAELVRSREEVVRSARRTELVFLALTEALPGAVLDDKYRIEEKIGSGSFGTVYRGTHLLLGTPVAVKVLRPCQGRDELATLDRLRQEGISAWRLRHPNVVTVLDFAAVMDSIAYLVMELLEGHALSAELATCGQLSAARTAEIMEPVCSALAEAHALGVIHRDVKPSNVFLHRSTWGEVVKVIDFGIAKMLDAEPGSDGQMRTATGLFMGTPAYAAPERLEGAAPSGAMDVYSVGVTLYEALSGRLPFHANAGEWATALMHLTQAPPPLRAYVAGVPAVLDAAVMEALSKDPAARPSAAELRDVLCSLRPGDVPHHARASV